MVDKPSEQGVRTGAERGNALFFFVFGGVWESSKKLHFKKTAPLYFFLSNTLAPKTPDPRNPWI
jgi:hypothetical protein